jgi:hypothetical protein
MADEEPGLPPVEISWRLAATTQPLAAGEVDETTISIFFFEPAEGSCSRARRRASCLEGHFAVSPAAFWPARRPSREARSAGRAVLPHAADLKVRKSTGELGNDARTHSAAPHAGRSRSASSASTG